MIHIYCGDGKGKTTAAMGLAVRAAGHGRRVAVAQFLKSGKSGEREILASLPGVELLPIPEEMKFTFRMTPEEKAAEAVRQKDLAAQAFARGGKVDLLVLDELCAALSTGMLELSWVLEQLDACPEGLEVVVTGRNPPPSWRSGRPISPEMKKHSTPLTPGFPPGRAWSGDFFVKK